MRLDTATIVCQTALGDNVYRMSLACPGIAGRARPGQFIMLYLPGEQRDPLLPRPFSIHRRITQPEGRDGIELLYKVVGRGTRWMADLPSGQAVQVLGPLGRGFSLPESPTSVYLAAGGMGVAPILFLATEMQRRWKDLRHCRLFLGARTRAELLCEPDFETLGIPVHRSTDDGSLGDQCLLTDPLEIAAQQHAPTVIAACGPMPMLSCVAGISRRLGIPCQVSVEAHMACGMGVCLGCAVPSSGHGQYLHVCREGPVFDAENLGWD